MKVVGTHIKVLSLEILMWSIKAPTLTVQFISEFTELQNDKQDRNNMPPNLRLLWRPTSKFYHKIIKFELIWTYFIVHILLSLLWRHCTCLDWIQVLTTVNPLPFSRSRARWVEEEEKSSRYFCSVGSRIFLNKTINKTPWAISLTWIKSLYRKAHLRKATIKLITRKNFIFFRIEWSLFVKTYSNLVKIGKMSLNKIFKIRQCIFATSWFSPIWKGLALYLSNLEFLSPKDTLCQVWLKLAQLFWRKWIFNFIKVSGELKGRHFWKWIYLWTIWALQSI